MTPNSENKPRVIIPRSFYDRPAPQVAPQLVGCRLVRILNGQRLAGLITETEAYQGEEDLACHARIGLTPRTEPMYGPPGHAYIYFTYGMHWLLNAVTDKEGVPAAVLIRGLLPIEGLEQMAALRPALNHDKAWLDGPAKLAQALALDGSLNRTDLCAPDSNLFIETGVHVPPEALQMKPRVGINSVPEPWRSMPWRWQIDLQTLQKLSSGLQLAHDL
ncbi:MAG TPA: DNA-3-methyladenine glycosylase [Anaerolineaceae bacterium]|nr:DNA-3-methyladenine glycosylase [Anaerolineaceae bacterium]